MFKAYSLNILQPKDITGSYMLSKGSSLLAPHKKSIHEALESYIVQTDGKTDTLDASRIKNDWFPDVSADIFLSHSHKDEYLATCLAGWLKEKFNINCFIDSMVWGYSNDLLRSLDNKYCYDSASNTYNYDDRNKTTTHVHLLLSVALANMLDKCECCMFLNTPNSSVPKNPVNPGHTSTYSPWIYNELSIVNSMRVRSRENHRGMTKNAALRLTERRADSFRVEFLADTSSLDSISEQTLASWVYKWNQNKHRTNYALDMLYELTV